MDAVIAEVLQIQCPNYCGLFVKRRREDRAKDPRQVTSPAG